jgi:hypothetical protein
LEALAFPHKKPRPGNRRPLYRPHRQLKIKHGKGGIGKSTTTQNLVSALAELGNNVKKNTKSPGLNTTSLARLKSPSHCAKLPRCSMKRFKQARKKLSPNTSPNTTRLSPSTNLACKASA